MIRLSKLTDYAVVMLAAMAERDGALVSASVLSESLSLPEPTVAKVLKLLVKGGIARSERGIAGGYALAYPAQDITVHDIITAMEGPVALVSCVGEEGEGCAIVEFCLLRGRWDVVNKTIAEALENVSLKDMLPHSSSRQIKSKETKK